MEPWNLGSQPYARTPIGKPSHRNSTGRYRVALLDGISLNIDYTTLAFSAFTPAPLLALSYRWLRRQLRGRSLSWRHLHLHSRPQARQLTLSFSFLLLLLRPVRIRPSRFGQSSRNLPENVLPLICYIVIARTATPRTVCCPPLYDLRRSRYLAGRDSKAARKSPKSIALVP